MRSGVQREQEAQAVLGADLADDHREDRIGTTSESALSRSAVQSRMSDGGPTDRQPIHAVWSGERSTSGRLQHIETLRRPPLQPTPTCRQKRIYYKEVFSPGAPLQV